MDLPVQEDAVPGTRAEQKQTGRPWVRVAAIVLMIAFWGGLLYGAYYLVTDYIDRSVRTVQETNALHVQSLEERLDAIQAELGEVKDILADTDQILAGTDSTQEALTQRIEALDSQLEQLERSLEALRKSPNVAH